MIKPESVLRDRISNYLQINHPMIPYRFDLAADLKLTAGQAIKHKKINGRWRGFPDLFIATTRCKYGGLFVELKATKTLLKNEHTQRQAAVHQILRDNGYFVKFVLGYADAVNTIEEYLSLS